MGSVKVRFRDGSEKVFPDVSTDELPFNDAKAKKKVWEFPQFKVKYYIQSLPDRATIIVLFKKKRGEKPMQILQMAVKPWCEGEETDTSEAPFAMCHN